jgi:hypothetical protein
MIFYIFLVCFASNLFDRIEYFGDFVRAVADGAKRALLITVPLPAIIGLALAVRACADRAGEHLVPYLGTFYPKEVVILDGLPWWKSFLPLKVLGGRWGTTGFLLVHWLEKVFGEPNTFYLLTVVMVVVGYLLTWLAFRSFSMAILVGIALATTTFNYHVYSVPGSVVMLPLISFLLLFTYCQIEWLQTAAHGWIWGGATLVSCVLFALAYEGWLDLVPLGWIIYPALAWRFRRSGDTGRSMRCLLLLGLVTLVAVAYTTIKAHSGLGELHPRGGEADLIFTYGHDHKLLMFEDILSSFITFFFTTITTNLPPELFSFSLSSWQYGPEEIVALQEGYHAPATHLTHYNHLFLWRYYAGFALALFLTAYWKVTKAFFKSGNTHHLVLFVLMTCTLIGSPTHLMIKWRPMHAAPLLGYQVYLSVIGWTLLLCYVVSRGCSALGGKRGLALASLLVLNFCYCAYARPALLSHMSREVFLGTYPDPRKNLRLLGFSRTRLPPSKRAGEGAR